MLIAIHALSASRCDKKIHVNFQFLQRSKEVYVLEVLAKVGIAIAIFQ